MDKKISSYYFLLLAFALYDIKVKQATGFPVNLVIFFYISIYIFILYRIFIDMFETKDNFKRLLLVVISSIFIGRIWLNIMAINQSKEIYNYFVNNEYLDQLQWFIVIALTVIALWLNFIKLRVL